MRFFPEGFCSFQIVLKLALKIVPILYLIEHLYLSFRLNMYCNDFYLIIGGQNYSSTFWLNIDIINEKKDVTEVL